MMDDTAALAEYTSIELAWSETQYVDESKSALFVGIFLARTTFWNTYTTEPTFPESNSFWTTLFA